MELAYIFLKNYRVIKDQGFNLSSNYNVLFDSKKSKLSVFNSNNFNGFYGKNIRNLKCIVGQNGAGKTSLLNFIKEKLALPIGMLDELDDCLLVFIDTDQQLIQILWNGVPIKKKDIECEINFDVKISTISDALEQVNGSGDLDKAKYENAVLSLVQDFKQTSFLYMSNIFDGRQEIDYGPKQLPFVYNKSANFLLKKETDGTSTYTNGETLKNIKLILNAKEDIPSFKLPGKISIQLKDILVRDFFSKEVRRQLGTLKNEIVSSLSEKSRGKGSSQEKFRFFVNSYMLLQMDPFLDDDTRGIIEKELSASAGYPNWKRINKTIKEGAQKFREVKRGEYILLNSNSWPHLTNEYISFIELLDFAFNEKSDLKLFNFSIQLNSDNEQILNDIIEKSQISAILGYNVLHFSWHELSSGETMLLRLFSNLYEFAEELKKEGVPNMKLFFLLDEVETYFHPEWQRKLIRILLAFIEKYFSDYKIDLVLTTHSPLLLSDFLKSDVIFMKKEKESVLVLQTLNDKKETFASNIHMLLANSFFMENGLIGEFAVDKINSLIDFLESKQASDEKWDRDQAYKMIEKVGEPLIKEDLTELYLRKFYDEQNILKEIERLKNILEKGKNDSN